MCRSSGKTRRTRSVSFERQENRAEPQGLLRLPNPALESEPRKACRRLGLRKSPDS
jgi:hypothetical protein